MFQLIQPYREQDEVEMIERDFPLPQERAEPTGQGKAA